MGTITLYKRDVAEKKFGLQYIIEEILLAYVMNDKVPEDAILLGIGTNGKARWRPANS